MNWGDLAELIAQERAELSAEQQARAKEAAALAALELVKPGMTLGLGTGSTVAFLLRALAQRQRESGWALQGVPTSKATAEVARDLGIALVDQGEPRCLRNDLCLDGADRVDARGFLIKGGGGALLREKMVAAASSRVCILVDATKLEPVLSDAFPLPVECLAFGVETTLERLAALGCRPVLRQRQGQPVLSDNGHCLVDCHELGALEQASELQDAVRAIPGVVEVGLFLHLMHTLVLGRPDGSARLWPAPSGSDS